MNGIPQKQIQGKLLFPVAGLNPGNPAVGKLADGNQFSAVTFDDAEGGVVWIGLVDERDGFVGAEGAGDFGGSGFEEAIDDVGFDPSFGGSGVEIGKIHLIGFIVLGVESKGIGFDSEVGVFADEYNIAIAVAL